MRKLIALLGMPGSGKTEAIHYLETKYGWPKVYFGQVTFDEMERRGLPINPQNERFVREDLRDRFGEDYYAKEVIKKIEALGDVPFILVESLYSLKEYRVLKEHFGDELVTIVVHAAPRVRYARLTHRPVRPLTEDEARVRDISQLERLNQGGPIALADHIVVNESGIEQFQAEIDRVVGEM